MKLRWESKGFAAETAEDLALYQFQYGIGWTEACTGRTRVDTADPAVEGIFPVVIAHMGMTVQEDIGFFTGSAGGGVQDVVFDVGGVAVGQEEAEAICFHDAAGGQLAGGRPFVTVAFYGVGGNVGIFLLQFGKVAPAVTEVDQHIDGAVGEVVLYVLLHELGISVGIGENENFHEETPLGMGGIFGWVAYTGDERIIFRRGFMKLDKKMIDQMLSLPDDKLWQMFQLLSMGSGLKMGDKAPDPAGMRKLRAVLEDITDADIARVLELIDLYKKTK